METALRSSQIPGQHFPQADSSGRAELLPAARQHFQAMLTINAEMAEADLARKNIATINAFLSK